MTPEELRSLQVGEWVIVNGREMHTTYDAGAFVNEMECRIGQIYRVKEVSYSTVRLMDESGNDIGWFWYPSHIMRVDTIDPIPETELMNLIFGA